MIKSYTEEEIAKLPFPNISNIESPKSKSIINVLTFIAVWTVFLLLLPLLIAFAIYLIVTVSIANRKKGEVNDTNEEVIPEEELNLSVKIDYSEKSQIMDIYLNHDALKVFISVIYEAYSKGSGVMMGNLTSLIPIQNKGWHSHSEFWWPNTDFELTIGTEETDLLKINSGSYICGKPKIWVAFANELLIFATKTGTIVLDSNETNWCTSDSTGRVVFHVCE